MYSIDYLFSKESEWKSFHDVVAEVVTEIENREYSAAELRNVFDSLPTSIKDVAQIWGISDTVFRDDAYVFLRDNPEILKAALAKKTTSVESPDPVAEFDKVVRCLALQLPEEVWDDVNTKWQNLKSTKLS